MKTYDATCLHPFKGGGDYCEHIDREAQGDDERCGWGRELHPREILQESLTITAGPLNMYDNPRRVWVQREMSDNSREYPSLLGGLRVSVYAPDALPNDPPIFEGWAHEAHEHLEPGTYPVTTEH